MTISFFACALAALFSGVVQGGNSVDVYFGTGGNNTEQVAGVYHSSLNEEKPDLARPQLLYELKGAGWVAHHPTKAVLYSTGTVDGAASVVALNLEKKDAPLMGSQPIGDGGSCFLTTDRTGSMLISAQYGGGSVVVYPLNDDGSVGERSQLLEHEGGSGAVKNRQDSPHPHYIAISPDNRFAFVPDLGLDQLVVYAIDVASKKLIENGKVDVVKGGGPRHMKFHPSGKFAFVLNELTLAVSVFKYTAESGSMEMIETVPALTEQEKAMQKFNSSSEIRVHPNGKLLFSANRGHDSISVYKFDDSTGNLIRTQVAPIHGSFPRNFCLSPNGEILLAAGAHSNSISLFTIDSEKSELRHVFRGNEFVPGPICVSFDYEN